MPDHGLARWSGSRLPRIDGDHPAAVQIGEVGGGNCSAAAARGGQIGIEKRAFECVERVGSADDELTAPVEPIDERPLLLGCEGLRIDVVPENVGDAGPGERVVGQRDGVLDLEQLG